MKLLFFISSLSAGGGERVATSLANHWAEQGWKVTIVTLAGIDKDFYSLSPDIKRITLQRSGHSRGVVSGLWNNITRVRALRRVLLREGPDIALGFMASSNILCGLACIGTGIVCVGTEHNHPPMSPLGQPWHALRRLVYPRLAAVSALTDRSAEWIRLNTGAVNVPVLPNPVQYPMPAGQLGQDPYEIKTKFGGEKFLLAVGRLIHVKGFDRLLEAFARVQQSIPEWRLIILGEGPLRGALEQQRDDLGLFDVVALPGAVANVGEWYEACDLFVLTSRSEGFPMTLLEALACGLPAIAVDCATGPREIVRHEVDGLLVPQDDPAALVTALNRMMTNEASRSRFSERAVEVRERFSMKRIADQWELLFRDLSLTDFKGGS